MDSHFKTSWYLIVSGAYWAASARNIFIVISGPPKASNKYQKMLKLNDAFF